MIPAGERKSKIKTLQGDILALNSISRFPNS
jgi:hypothetical protein